MAILKFNKSKAEAKNIDSVDNADNTTDKYCSVFIADETPSIKKNVLCTRKTTVTFLCGFLSALACVGVLVVVVGMCWNIDADVHTMEESAFKRVTQINKDKQPLEQMQSEMNTMINRAVVGKHTQPRTTTTTTTTTRTTTQPTTATEIAIATLPGTAGGWSVFQDRRYILIKVEKSRFEANDTCHTAFGGILAEPRTLEQRNFITELVRQDGYYTVWTGGNRLDTEGRWTWSSDGAAITDWSSWSHYYYNLLRGAHNADCLLMSTGHVMYWKDAQCTRRHYFVCQKPLPGF